MTGRIADDLFSGSLATVYEKYLVPLLFQCYADDLVSRLTSSSPTRVLEIAAGTGVVTRAMASALPEGVAIVATDRNQPMIDQAAAIGTKRPVEWRQADALQLPFEDESFDAVVCQFGVMFFADQAKAFSEARRVLRAGGVYLFNTWDRIEENELADVVTTTLASVFPDDPPRFMARTPHGYSDTEIVKRDLGAGGFAAPAQLTTLAARSRAESARDAAIAYCLGSPLRNEIEARDASRLEEATGAAADAIARRFGSGAIDSKIQAHILAVPK